MKPRRKTPTKALPHPHWSHPQWPKLSPELSLSEPYPRRCCTHAIRAHRARLAVRIRGLTAPGPGHPACCAGCPSLTATGLDPPVSNRPSCSTRSRFSQFLTQIDPTPVRFNTSSFRELFKGLPVLRFIRNSVFQQFLMFRTRW